MGHLKPGRDFPVHSFLKREHLTLDDTDLQVVGDGIAIPAQHAGKLHGATNPILCEELVAGQWLQHRPRSLRGCHEEGAPLATGQTPNHGRTQCPCHVGNAHPGIRPGMVDTIN